jgi:hypothetical protein
VFIISQTYVKFDILRRNKMIKKIGGFIVFMVFICSIVLYNTIPDKKDYQANAEASTIENVAYVYLINSMLARMPNGDIKMVYRIKICDRYTIGNNVICIKPVLSSTFGYEMVIPLYNVRAIVKGNNKFKEHLIERE